jgi:hypothetical protein
LWFKKLLIFQTKKLDPDRYQNLSLLNEFRYNFPVAVSKFIIKKNIFLLQYQKYQSSVKIKIIFPLCKQNLSSFHDECFHFPCTAIKIIINKSRTLSVSCSANKIYHRYMMSTLTFLFRIQYLTSFHDEHFLIVEWKIMIFLHGIM